MQSRYIIYHVWYIPKHWKGCAGMYLYPRIRDLREDHDLTQKYVAALIGTTQQYYSEYERGVREIPLHSFIKLARFYGVSLEKLAENAKKVK